MKSIKCPNCGAYVSINESKNVGICEYCSTPLVFEKTLSDVNDKSNNTQTIINNYYNTPNPNIDIKNHSLQSVEKSHRPEVNVLVAFILCCFYIWPGLIYIFSIKSAQKEWDKRHKK